jgi:glycosyltransferase involved in cell wall biosynthesis
MQKSIFVIIPTFNGAEDLAASIESVLGQSYRDFTLVVVDNGSTDNSRQIIEEYQAKDSRGQKLWVYRRYQPRSGTRHQRKRRIRRTLQ